MADFCRECVVNVLGVENPKLDFGCKDDEVALILCEGCGKQVWVKKDGTRVSCNNCEYADSGVCANGAGEISNDYYCEQWKARQL